MSLQISSLTLSDRHPAPFYLFSSTTLVYSKKKQQQKAQNTPNGNGQNIYSNCSIHTPTHTHTHIRTVRCNCVYLAKRADAWACVIVDIHMYAHTRTQSRQTGLKNVEIMKMTVKSTKRSARRQRGE